MDPESPEPSEFDHFTNGEAPVDLDAPVDPDVGVVPTSKFGYLPANIPGVLEWVVAQDLEDEHPSDGPLAARSDFELRAPAEFAYRRVAPGCWVRWDGTRVSSCWRWAPKHWVDRGDTK